jgi:hypothetical protein
MANFKLNGVTVASETGGTATLDSGTVVPAAGITGVLPVGVTGGSGLTALGTVTAGNIDGISDIKKVASGAFTSVSSIDIQQCFTSTYKFYKLVWGGMTIVPPSMPGGTDYLEVGYLGVTNNHLTSTYYSRGSGEYASATGWAAATGNTGFYQSDSHGFRLNNTWQQDLITEGCSGEIQFYDPLSSRKQIVYWQSVWSQGEGYKGITNGYGIQNTTTAKHGLRLGTSTGINFTADGHWAVYGYKA